MLNERGGSERGGSGQGGSVRGGNAAGPFVQYEPRQCEKVLLIH